MWSSPLKDGTGSNLGDVLVTTDTGQSDTTNNGGKYTINDVPEGERTVTTTKVAYDCGPPVLVTVVAGQTSTQDFTCTLIP